MEKNTTKASGSYSHLCIEEREELAIGISKGESLGSIACRMGRHKSSLSRELNRNQPETYSVNYRANRAQLRSDDRKALAHQRDRLKLPEIRVYVDAKLKEGWTPEIIAGRLLIDHPGLSTNYESIYQWIYAERRDLIASLARSHKKRRKRGSAKGKRVIRVPNRTPIEQRPIAATDRQEAGHWEADTAVSRQSKAAISVAQERSTRLVRIRKIESKTAAHMADSLITALADIPQKFRKTITYDNGTENAQHERTNQALGVASFFCNPYHSWEKGGVENCIGLIRRFYPKKTDWALLSQADLDIVELKLNTRPKKCLGFLTPQEAFVALAA